MGKKVGERVSLYLLLGGVIISTVVVIMSVDAAYDYTKTKKKIIKQMKQNSKRSIVALEKNVANLIESYAVNEYNKLVLTEIEQRDLFAIVIEDYNMGQIVGKEAYTSGKIRNDEWEILDYDPKNAEHARQLGECFYSEQHAVTTAEETQLGMIKICISDRGLNEELNSIITHTLINMLSISLLLGMALFFIIRQIILKPLTNIIEAIEKSDEDGIPLERVPSSGSNEISKLSHTMNIMIDSIRHSRVQLQEQHDSLQYQATHDALTGLANRVLFNDRLSQGIEKARRNSTNLAVLFVDLDHFKEINDSFGHKTGDKVLTTVTERLSRAIRKEDTLARLGGDEFTIMIEGLRQPEDASVLASKILQVLAKEIIIDEHRFFVGSSIGISLFPENGESSADLLKNADAAMYKAKQEGRNNFQYYSSEMTVQAFERVFMETNLRTAFENGEFVVYYQPQIDAQGKTLAGMEALVRWQSPQMGLVSPANFIPIAESTGLIIELDRLVMREAMTQLSQWVEAGLEPGVLAMNLTIKQLKQDDFIAYVKELMVQTACKPQWLEFEITESGVMSDPEEMISVLQQINEMGIRLSLDDFGTGYSSLEYLKKMPISKLKIDRSFVKDLPEDDEDAAITKAVIALAESLNLDIIAEGVETKSQLDFLLQNGCKMIQGYFYAKPMSSEQMERYITSGQKF